MATYRRVITPDAWTEFQKHLRPPLQKAAMINGCMEDVLKALSAVHFKPLPRTTSTCGIWKVVEENRKAFCIAIKRSMESMAKNPDRVVCVSTNSEVRAKFKHFLQQYIQTEEGDQLLRAQLFLSILECI